MLEKIKETTNFIQEKINFAPQVAVILGTGLGGLTDKIDISVEIPYEQIPNFPVSTVEGHSGKLIFGKWAGKNVVAMKGRFHYYEGYDMKQVTFPIRVFKYLGIKLLVVSNASGGMNPNFNLGTIMAINDHINLFPEHPLRGQNFNELGPRFPDMGEPYSKKLIEKAHIIADENKFDFAEGVYVGVSGPTFETKAEYKYLRTIGGDAVGMSTVPEVIVARHMDIPVFALSVITDSGVSGKIVEISHEDVQKVANESEPKMTKIVHDIIKDF